MFITKMKPLYGEERLPFVKHCLRDKSSIIIKGYMIVSYKLSRETNV